MSRAGGAPEVPSAVPCVLQQPPILSIKAANYKNTEVSKDSKEKKRKRKKTAFSFPFLYDQVKLHSFGHDSALMYRRFLEKCELKKKKTKAQLG